MANFKWFWGVFEGVRRIVVFVLGVAIILYALVDPESDNTVAMLIIGMVMVGILPVENLMAWFPSRGKERIRQ